MSSFDFAQIYFLKLNFASKNTGVHTVKQLINGDLKGVSSLKLSENLKEFPREIFDLANTLESLDLSSNRLSALPEDFGKLKNLKTFFCSDNLFSVLPSVLGDCPALDIIGFKSNQIETISMGALNKNLRWLILTNNKLQNIPSEIGKCWRLQKLMLAGNRLSSLPEELKDCKQLALLRVSANNLIKLPKWLYGMPNLAWLAFSGNDFNRKPLIQHDLAMDLKEFSVSVKLGEGASGTIYKAINSCTNQTVAIKMFKGEVTSDGYPDDEMNAFIGAGTHDGLVKLLGEVSESASGKRGLVMELIPPTFYNLGNPPSLISCTRDVFKDKDLMDSDQLLKIALRMASVCAQLHEKGINHGDLYAHNILIDEAGNSLLGDFGAASFYEKGSEQAFYLERIEVKAYGYLLDDLISVCRTSSIKQILGIRDRCLWPDINIRPRFSAIVNELQSLIKA